MPPTSMPPPALPQRIAGDLALDLANTISRRGTARETDHLATDGEVLAWAREGGLVGPDFQPAQAPMAELAAQVRELRHAIGEVGAAIALGGEAPPAALRVVGRHAAIALEGATLRGCRCVSTSKGRTGSPGPSPGPPSISYAGPSSRA